MQYKNVKIAKLLMPCMALTIFHNCPILRPVSTIFHSQLEPIAKPQPQLVTL